MIEIRLSKFIQFFMCFLVLCIIIIMIILVLYFLKHKEYQVELFPYKSIECKVYDSNNIESYTWWDVLHYADERPNPLNYPNFSLDDIDFSGVDFNNYNVVLSQGRKINKLVYIKDKKFPYLPLKKGTSIAYFDKNYYSNSVFIYLIHKNENVIFDLKCNPQMISIIEN